jgi:hypothetical protein
MVKGYEGGFYKLYITLFITFVLVITSALENNCSILYTEDMQEGQVLNCGLTIVLGAQVIAELERKTDELTEEKLSGFET